MFVRALWERHQALLRWAFVLLGGPLAVALTVFYHLFTAPISPILPYFLVTLILLPAWEAGVGFLIAVSYTTYLQVTSAPATPVLIVTRLLILGVLFVLIVSVKTRLERTRQERSRFQHEATERRMALVLESAPEGILVCDQAGTIQQANAPLAQLAGYERSALLGQPVELLLPGHVAARHQRLRERYNQDPYARPMGRGLELVLRRQDGSEVPVEIALNPYREGAGLSVIAHVVDISVRKRLEAERMQAQLGAEEAEMRAVAAERRSHERSAFMSSTAHELRTPLTSVRGYAEILLDSMAVTAGMEERGEVTLNAAYRAQRTKQERSVRAIRRQADKLEQLVTLLLDVSRLEVGRLSVAPVADDLAKVVREAVTALQEADDGHPLDLDLPEELPATFDPLRLDQAVTNVVRNAQQYSPAGTTITVRLEQRGGRARITVSDQGPGIPESERPLVFDKFYQIGRTERSQGMGLGLFLTKSFVELHGGTVAVLDGPGGRGTTIELILPLRPGAPTRDAGAVLP